MICWGKYYIQLDKALFNDLRASVLRYNSLRESKFKLQMDYLVYFLDLIIRLSLDKKIPTGNYVHIPSNILNPLCRNRHKEHKDFLKNNGFIKLAPYDTEKNRSFGYRIVWFDNLRSTCYNSNSFEKYELIRLKSKLIGELNEDRDKRKEKASKSTGHLTKWLDEKYIKIDEEGAYNWINQNHNLSPEKKYQYAVTVRNLEVNNWRYSREGKDNRLHSNLTNLCSELRQFLTFQGRPLVSLDIKSSQPFLMSAVLEMISEGNLRDREFVNRCLDKRMKVSKKWIQVFSIMNYKLLEPQSRQEFKAFKKHVIEGDIYNWLAKELPDNFLEKLTTQDGQFSLTVYNPETERRESKLFKCKRDLTKVLFLEFMYSGLGSTTLSYKAVQKILPKIIVEFIAEFKKCEWSNKKGKKKKNKKQRKKIKESQKDFSAFLQHFEAFLILDIITKDLAEDYPDMFMATIHDSIIVTKENSNLVKGTLENRMEYLTGLKPEIKYERWGNH